MRWRQRWLELLDDSDPATARRIARGKGYARAGRVTDVRVTTGGVSGRVHGSKATAYPVEVTVDPLTDEQWEAVVGVLAGQVRHSAQVLAGQVSDSLEQELAQRGVRLMPTPAGIAPSCPCDDDAVLCAHVAAVWEAAGQRLAADPLVLLRLRGRGRERLLADLAAARRRSTPSSAGIPLERLDVSGWSRLRAPLDPAGPLVGAGRSGTSVAPRLPDMGDPPGWEGGVSAWDLLRPLVERAAAWADER